MNDSTNELRIDFYFYFIQFLSIKVDILFFTQDFSERKP